MVRWLIFILLMVSFVSAVDVDFDCPDSIFEDEEFECELEIFDGSGFYDVKVELDEDRDSVLKIWDEGEDEWLSGYYYLSEFAEDGEATDVRLKVSEDGRYDAVLKLRQDGKRDFFDVGRISVREARAPLENFSVVDVEVDVISGEVVEDVVVLNDGVVYESRDSWIVDKLVYGFVVFLIFVIVILVWERGRASG